MKASARANDQPSPPPRWQAPVRQGLSAFASRDFRWLWASNVLAAMGFNVEMLAQGWLVLQMTDSPFWVGAVSGLRGGGLVAFGALGGLLADRVSRRDALVAVQVLRALSLLALGLLIVGGRVELWHILAIGLFQGLLMAFTIPAANALIYDTVGRERLLNAMAARGVAFNVARIVGSLLAGAVISALGVGASYLAVTALTLLSAAALLFLARLRPTISTAEPWWRTLMEGIGYVAAHRSLRVLLLLSFLVEMFGFSHSVMLPVVARDVLHVGAAGLGLLSAAGGMGAMVGTVIIAGLGDFRAKGALLMVSSGAAGLFLLLFALSPWFLLSLVLSALVWAALMGYDATMATVLQLLSTDAMRGRVMGLYGLTFGFTPVGGFAAGSIATALSVPFAIGLGGVLIFTYSAVALRLLGRLREAAVVVPGVDSAASRSLP